MARNFRTCRVTSMSMETSLVPFFQDGRYTTGAILAAGDGPNFPLTVPGNVETSALQVKKVVAPGAPSKLWYNCNRENNQALIYDVPWDSVLPNQYAQVVTFGPYTQGLPDGVPAALVICKWYVLLQGRRNGV